MSENEGQELWTEVERYVAATLLPPDPGMEGAVAASEEAGLPSIQVAPSEAAFLALLVRLRGARTVLEVGTLGGYSAIAMARALPPGGRIVTLEKDPETAAVARTNLERAGVADTVEVRVGPAAETLARMRAAAEGPFDLVFIDADKAGTADYFDAALALGRPGTLIVVDNVVRGGALVRAGDEDADAAGMRRFLARAAAERRVQATVLQTVGSKGHDGIAVALVTS